MEVRTKKIALRACDACRRRKVRCDHIVPQCSNCRMSDLTCLYISPARKRGPKPKVVPPSYAGPPGKTQAPSLSTPVRLATRLPRDGSSVPYREFRQSPKDGDVCSLSSNHTSIMWPVDSDPLAQLTETLSEILSDQSLEALVIECIDLYMQLLYPLMPIVHETTLRANASLELLETPGSRAGNASHLRPINPDGSEILSNSTILAKMRLFTLITAVCAEVAFVLPSQIFPKGPLIAVPFLNTSRNVLRLYHDPDIEQPTALSVIVRYFHSNCTHAWGKTRLSWFIMGEAIRIAQDMQLYYESSLEGLDEVEAQLRRSIFWQLFTGDKSSSILNNRPVALFEIPTQIKYNIKYLSPEDVHLMDHTAEHNTIEFEQRVNIGFNMCQRLWGCASELILRLKALLSDSSHDFGSPTLTPEQETSIVQAYLEFSTVLDDMPPWLQRPDSIILPGASHVQAYQCRCFWSQRTNLQVTFYCLRLILFQHFTACGLSTLLGFSNQPIFLSLRKTELAQDMLKAIGEAPFESLQVNGEPCIEKIRQIGASLLQIVHDTDNESIAARAKSSFTILLDILTRLDSRASDSLVVQP